MKDSKCTGSENRTFLMHANCKGWHGKFGHFNLLKLDHDSNVTGKGSHDRVLATGPDSEGLYFRIDHLWELGQPTDKQLFKVAKSEGWKVNLKDWEIASRERYSSTRYGNTFEHTDVQFKRKDSE